MPIEEGGGESKVVELEQWRKDRDPALGAAWRANRAASNAEKRENKRRAALARDWVKRFKRGWLTEADAARLAGSLYWAAEKVPKLRKGEWMKEAGVASEEDTNPAAHCDKYLYCESGDIERDKKRKRRLRRKPQKYLDLVDRLVEKYPSVFPDPNRLVAEVFYPLFQKDGYLQEVDGHRALYEKLKNGCEIVIERHGLQRIGAELARHRLTWIDGADPEYRAGSAGWGEEPVYPDVALGTVIVRKFDVQVEDEYNRVRPAILHVTRLVWLVLVFSDSKEPVRPILRLDPTNIHVEVDGAFYLWSGIDEFDSDQGEYDCHLLKKGEMGYYEEATELILHDAATCWKLVKAEQGKEQILPFSFEDTNQIFSFEHAFRIDAFQPHDYTPNAYDTRTAAGTLAGYVEASLLWDIEEHHYQPDEDEWLPGVLSLLDVRAREIVSVLSPGLEQFYEDTRTAHDRLDRQLEEASQRARAKSQTTDDHSE